MTARFRVLLRVQVAADRSAEFECEWQAGHDVVAGQPVNHGHWLARSDHEDDTYYVISDWTDEASFRAFESSEAHLRHRQALRPYHVNGSMTTMRIVAGGGARLEEVSR